MNRFMLKCKLQNTIMFTNKKKIFYNERNVKYESNAL